MNYKSAVERYKAIASEERFKGWPLVGVIEMIFKIPFFGHVIKYILKTGRGDEEYYSLLRNQGWVVVFGVNKDNEVITLCQWKPGANKPGWELPPGGVGKIESGMTTEDILERTKAAYLKETGYGGDDAQWKYLGPLGIETGKYRGVVSEDFGYYAHLFMATDLEQIADKRNPEGNEIMETIMVPLSEFRDVLQSGLFTEASAVPCAQGALIELGQLKWAQELS